MEKTIDKIKELEYNEFITISVIESDEDLTSVFKQVTPLSFKLIRSIAKQGKLNAETKDIMVSIFENVICTKKEYIQKYLRFMEGAIDNFPSSKEIINEESTENTVEEIKMITPIIESIDEPVEVVVKEKKEKELPRRFGKEKILLEIEKQGGKATPVQRAMLKVNSLKNLYVNLSARGIKDMVGGNHLLSDEDCRKITSVITIAERQLEEILKKK